MDPGPRSEGAEEMFPVCSFCGERPVVAWFEGPDFRGAVDAADKVRADEAWLACSACLMLVRAENRERLARRGTKRLRPGTDPDRAAAMIRTAHDRFWDARSGA
jgi:hypothetical protein